MTGTHVGGTPPTNRDGRAVVVPTRLEEALTHRSELPGRTVIAGGTDLMVAINAGRLRPEGLISLRKLDELRSWRIDDGDLVLGAGVSYKTLCSPEVAGYAPGLAQAARTVGSPQIRATGTLGGNIANASPAGDTLPVLEASGARVELASLRGRRTVAFVDLLRGPRQVAMAPDELITSVRIPVASGPQEYLKVGVRNAMVIAVVSCALIVDQERRLVSCALGSVGPRPVRSPEIDAWLASEIDWEAGTLRSANVPEGLGRQMARLAAPIDDHRATASYRRRAVAVLARRALERAFS